MLNFKSVLKYSILIKAGENVIKKEIYQITNISDLEKKIQTSRLDVLSVLNQIKEKQLTDTEIIVELLDKIQSELFECENFEFLLEKRTLIN